jgi:hypothetical protein
MKIENQVCAIKQSFELMSLGIKPLSYLKYGINSYNEKIISLDNCPDSRDTIVPAFSVAELVAMNENCYAIEFSNTEKKYYRMTDDKVIYFETFAQACADKLIYCLIMGWHDLEAVNGRLERS